MEHESGSETPSTLTKRQNEQGMETKRPPKQFVVSSENAVQVGFLVTVGVLLALLLGGAIENSIVIVTYVGAALFLALGLDPVVQRLMSWHFPRSLAILSVFVLVCLAITGALFLVIPAAVSQSTDIARQLPYFYDVMSQWQWYQNIDWSIRNSADEIATQLSTFLSDPTRILNIAGGVVSVGAEIANSFFGAFVVLVLTLYFMSSLEHIKPTIANLLPASKRSTFLGLSDKISHTIGRYVISQISVAAIHAILVYITMTILDIRFKEVLAVLCFLLAMLPLIGSVTAGILVTATTLVTVVIYGGNDPDMWKVFAIGIYYLVYMQVEAYLITPRIMTHNVKVPGIIVVIAALLGGTLMGLLGAVIAVPTAASVLILIQEMWVPRQNKR